MFRESESGSAVNNPPQIMIDADITMSFVERTLVNVFSMISLNV